MPQVEVSTLVQGRLNDVYTIASDMESYPNFMDDVKQVEVIERGEDYTITNWVTEVDGKTIRWTERDVFIPEQGKIVYQQIKGDLKKFEGYWQITQNQNQDQDQDQVFVRLSVDFDLGIPMLSTIMNPLLVKKVKANSESMLKAIKQRVESYL